MPCGYVSKEFLDYWLLFILHEGGKNILNIEVIEKFAVRVKERHLKVNSLSFVTCVASLAYHGLLGQEEKITCLGLSNIDLTSIPTEHLAALASWVASSCVVSIYRISGIGLASFLKSLKCHSFRIHGMILSLEETEALVQAMEARVKTVHLGPDTLEMETLLTYSGQGLCCCLCVDNPAWPRVKINMKEPLKNWALSQDWAVTQDNSSLFVVKRR